MSKEKENKDGGFVDRYILKRKEMRFQAGLGNVTEGIRRRLKTIGLVIQ
jgi:hypothetical protein